MKDDPDLAQMILEHDADEPVPHDHERRIREGLAALLTMPGAVPSPPEVPEVPAHPPGGSGAQGLAGSAAARWIAMGLVTAAAAGIGFAVGRSTAPASTPVDSLGPTSAAPSSIAPVAPSAAPSAVTPPSAAASPAVSLAPAVPPAVSAPRVTTSADPGGDAFDREQSLLERARSALVRHDPAAAEIALSESERSFPRSRHAEERDYLRIQIFRERGDTAKTREAAKAFLVRYPDSLLRARVEPLTN